MTACLAPICPTVHSLLTVNTISRRTKPNSNSYLVRAGGKLYVMKVFPAESTACFARREIFAHAMGVKLGFSMAHWEVLHVSDQTIADYKTSPQGLADSSAALCSGIHFGSLVPEGPGSLSELLPQSSIKANPELARQLAYAHLFDLWVAHADALCWAAVSDSDNKKNIYFFSYRNIFSPENPASSQMRASFAYEAACRISENRKGATAFLRSLAMLAPGELHAAFDKVPTFWRSASDEENAVRFLRTRSQWLATLMLTSFKMPVQKGPIPAWVCDTGRGRQIQSLVVPS